VEGSGESEKQVVKRSVLFSDVGAVMGRLGVAFFEESLMRLF